MDESQGLPQPLPDVLEEQNQKLISAAVQQGMLDAGAVARAARLLAQAQGQSLAGLLLREGLLSREELRSLLAGLPAKVLRCTGCSLYFLVEAPGLDHPCPRCGGALALEEITPPSAFRPGGEDRYVRGEELGRGGLGRVLHARDRVLGRTVAIKEMCDFTDRQHYVERFLREGEIAGTLSHPNIIPIHDVGVRREGTTRVPYFVMSRVSGSDLSQILRLVRQGDEAARARFTRRRLLSIVRDVCLAMRYAHDNGVIHRDLKPANVMVGEYGEVYVVDWGLAKILGEPKAEGKTEREERHGEKGEETVEDGGSPSSLPSSFIDTATALTLDGQVLGTPSYMSPEQAEGRAEEADKRSDVYSIGAILYEILTLHPPFEGDSKQDIITKVMSADFSRPSTQPPLWGEEVPGELEEICLRAMAHKPEERFPDVTSLLESLEAFEEGEKERERNRERARQQVATGRGLVTRLKDLREELKACEAGLRRDKFRIKPFWPLEKKAPYWELEARVDRLRLEVVKTFGRAGAAFQEALGFERNNPDARAALADLYWDQFLREEDADDAPLMAYFEELVREYNDGQYDGLLAGDGRLSLSTQRYPCPCLRDGRAVDPSEFDLMGYHPLSGRRLDGPDGAEGVADLEGTVPPRLKVHGPACETVPLAGARAWLFRYEEVQRTNRPVSPTGVSGGAVEPGCPPSAVLDRLFGPASPYRPEEGMFLGVTPLENLVLPMGSYLLVLAADGFRPVAAAVVVGRGESLDLTMTLYGDGEVPDEFVQVPGGRFVFQGDRKIPQAAPPMVLEPRDFFLARFPVSCGAYLDFLNAPEIAGTDLWKECTPWDQVNQKPFWPRDETGRHHLPTAAWVEEAPPSLRDAAGKLSQSEAWWHENWPVGWLVWAAAMRYCAWFAVQSGYLCSLPHEVQWEKGARGVDGRSFPWGDRFDPTFCNNNHAHERGIRFHEVDSFPLDASPYGVRGVAGNLPQFCINIPDPTHPGWRIGRGGTWTMEKEVCRVAHRLGIDVAIATPVGIRMVLLPHTVHPRPDGAR